MGLYEDIQATVAVVRSRAPDEPRVGVVLGSGLGAFADRITDAVTMPYAELPNFAESGVAGHRGELIVGRVAGVTVAVMAGRVHYYEGHSMERVTFPMRVLAGLGVSTVIITNAAGGTNPDYAPGDFMVIRDHINLTGQNPLRGPNDDRLGPRFPDMSEAYSRRGREALRRAASKVGVNLREGVYAGLAGPSYETPAEITMLRTLGADAVGMSTVAEVIVAAHAGLEVVGVSVITNRAAGLSATPLSHDEVKEVGARVGGVFCDLLAGAVAELA